MWCGETKNKCVEKLEKCWENVVYGKRKINVWKKMWCGLGEMKNKCMEKLEKFGKMWCGETKNKYVEENVFGENEK